MVKLQIKNEQPESVEAELVFEENEPTAAELELEKIEKKSRERESKIRKLEQRITELENENQNLLAACDRLNNELRTADRRIAELSNAQPDNTESVALIDSLIRRISVLKMNGKVSILNELRYIKQKLE